MDVSIQFLGAAGTVTGSKFLLDIGGMLLLVDCGMFQGERELSLRNWEELPVAPDKLDAVILTHAHMDHTGYLPRLVALGFQGPVHCTAATEDLMALLLTDAAHLQTEEYRRDTEDWDEDDIQAAAEDDDPTNDGPLFTQADVEATMALVRPHPLHERFQVLPRVHARYRDAGHILGAASIELTVEGEAQTKTLVFSGDLGVSDDPILEAPEPPPPADILVMETTYGDRARLDENPEADLARVLNMTFGRGGVVVIPSFAVGRTQLVLYYLRKLLQEGRLEPCQVYVDSPMAISATNLYYKHMSEAARNAHGVDETLFDYERFHYVRAVADSKALNLLKDHAVIISASGMATGGRILHHLYARLRKPQDTVLFVGYQGEGTLGRRLLQAPHSVRLFHRQVPVRCQVERIEGLSAHADRDELLDWARHLRDDPPKRTFLTHGDPESAAAFAELLRRDLGWPNVAVPQHLDRETLFRGI